jgi:hypothetical protein
MYMKLRLRSCVCVCVCVWLGFIHLLHLVHEINHVITLILFTYYWRQKCAYIWLIVTSKASIQLRMCA